MSWHYLQGQEEASWEGSSLDGAPSALLSLIHTQEPSCSQDKEMGFSTNSQSGMMCEPFKAETGEAEWMSCLAGSPAKTSLLLPAQERDSTGNAPDSGAKWPESFVKYDHDTSSWRTRQCSLFGGLEEFSGTWPRWGMMHAGECWGLATPGCLTTDSGSGLLPTIMHNEGEAFLGGPLRSSETWRDTSRLSHRLIGFWKCWTKRENNARTGLKVACHPTFAEWMMGWPIGWTGSQELGTDKLRRWLNLHGGC